MTQTFETGFKTTLAAKLDAADTTMMVATAPTVTKGRLYISNGKQEEWISFTGVSGTSITGLTRGLSQTADPTTSGTGLTWVAGTTVKLVAMHDQLADKLEGDSVLFSATTYATTTARDAALGGDGVAIKDYIGIKCTDTGLHYNYNTSSGQRESVDTGTTTPNASETVAGKVEEATDAEIAAGTGTGGTGAQLFVPPDKLSTFLQKGTAIYFASSTGSDTYTATMTPTLTAYTTGMALIGSFTTANTGACSINIDSLGAKNIKTVDGNDPQDGLIRAGSEHILIYDGTNFVIQTPDIASTSNKGIVEKATAAEVAAGTADKFPDCADLATYYGNYAIVNGSTTNYTTETSATVTIDLGVQFNTVQCAIIVSAQYSANPFYHAIYAFGNFKCGGSGIEFMPISNGTVDTQGDHYALTDITALSFGSSVNKITGGLSVTDTTTTTLGAVYKDGTNLKIDVTFTETGTYDDKRVIVGPITVIN